MDSKKWNEIIKNNFNDAAYRYLKHSNIQKFFAKKIVKFIKKINPKKKGDWIDLGSGPGLLADEIEKKFSSQKVSRIDYSKIMKGVIFQQIIIKQNGLKANLKKKSE